MDNRDDGLDEFEDSPLVRALRAPGTAAELADADRFVAAFRQAGRTRGGAVRGLRGGRIVGRIGVGGATLLATLTLTGGVAAAAYTQNLPEPVQALAHDAFGRVGVPEPRPVAPTPPPSAKAAPTQDRSTGAASSPAPGKRSQRPAPPRSTRSGSADASDTSSPSDGVTTDASGSPIASDATATGTASPGSTDTGSTTATPTTTTSTDPTAIPADPLSSKASVSATVAQRSVGVDGHTSILTTVVDDGEAVTDQEVWLEERRAKGRWSRVSSATTDSDGTATFASGTLQENTWFRVRVPAPTSSMPRRVLTSKQRRVAVRPDLFLKADGPTVLATVDGVRSGDAVAFSRRRADGRIVRVGIRRVGTSGQVSYDMSAFTGRVRVQVRVLRTRTHVATTRWITVQVPRDPQPTKPPTKPPTPTPTPTQSPSESPSASADAAGIVGRSRTIGS